MPHLGARNSVLMNLALAVIIGACLTSLSWLVVHDYYDSIRGFPLPWFSPTPLLWAPYLPTIMAQPDLSFGLTVDLLVWTWLSFVALLIPAGLSSVAIVCGLASIMVGVVVYYLLIPEFSDNISIFQLSLLAYSAIVLGVTTGVAGHRRSAAIGLLVCVTGGFLTTLVTGPVQFLVALRDPRSAFGRYGLPFTCMLATIPVPMRPPIPPDVLPTLEMYRDWGFSMDLIIWASLVVILLNLLINAKIKVSYVRPKRIRTNTRLSYLALTLTKKGEIIRVQTLVSSYSRTVGMLFGGSTVLTGLLLGFDRFILQSSSSFFLSTLSFLLVVLGVMTMTAGARKSEATTWLSAFAIGFLITLATGFVPMWFALQSPPELIFPHVFSKLPALPTSSLISRPFRGCYRSMC